MPAPSNDLIANALPLPVNLPIVGTTVEATVLPEEINYFGSTASVWYTFTPTLTQAITLSLTGTEAWDAEADTDGSLIILSGPPGATTDEGLSGVGNNFVVDGPQTGVSFVANAGQTYYIQVAGNGPTSGAFTLTAGAIAAPIITGFADDTGDPADNTTTDHQLIVSGLAPIGSTVQLYNYDATDTLTPVGAPVVATTGEWSIDTGMLADGTFRFTATSTPSGSSTPSELALILNVTVNPDVDVTPPEAPAALLLDPASDTGVPGNGITADTTPTVTGTAETGATVTLYDTDGTTVLGSVVAADGTWSITATELAAGAHTLQATATDPTGNVSPVSAGLAVTIALPRDPADFPAAEPGLDLAYYLANNPDVAAAGVDPVAHFQNFGWQEGRDPNAYFSPEYYLGQNPDVAAAGIDPLQHYTQFGGGEGRDPSTAFDSSAYLEANADVAAAGMNPLVHYLMFGQAEEREIAAATPRAPGPQDPLVDAGFYYSTYADVAALGIDPTGHYNQYGWQEGRDPDAFFDTSYYLETNADVTAAGMNPLAHYEQFGWLEGRDPSVAFDTSYYLEANPDVAGAGINPLAHYLQYGIDEGRSPIAPV